jgi:hypothetical protein
MLAEGLSVNAQNINNKTILSMDIQFKKLCKNKITEICPSPSCAQSK